MEITKNELKIRINEMVKYQANVFDELDNLFLHLVDDLSEIYLMSEKGTSIDIYSKDKYLTSLSEYENTEDLPIRILKKENIVHIWVDNEN